MLLVFCWLLFVLLLLLFKNPFNPIIRNNYLYGRGSSDDGYAIFSLLECIKIIQQENLPHGDVKIIIEGAEESGSPGLIEYLINFVSTDLYGQNLTQFLKIIKRGRYRVIFYRLLYFIS